MKEQVQQADFIPEAFKNKDGSVRFMTFAEKCRTRYLPLAGLMGLLGGVGIGCAFIAPALPWPLMTALAGVIPALTSLYQPPISMLDQIKLDQGVTALVAPDKLTPKDMKHAVVKECLSLQPRLFEDICRLSKQAGLKSPPAIHLPEDFEMQASGVFSPTIGIGQKLLACVDRDTLNGLICHELMHVKNKDLFWGRGILPGLQYSMYFFMLLTSIICVAVLPSLPLIGLGIAGIVTATGLSTLLLKNQRKNQERAADKGSALITGKPGVLAQCFTDHFYSRDLSTITSKFLHLFHDNHPSMTERISTLEQMQKTHYPHTLPLARQPEETLAEVIPLKTSFNGSDHAPSAPQTMPAQRQLKQRN